MGIARQGIGRLFGVIKPMRRTRAASACAPARAPGMRRSIAVFVDADNVNDEAVRSVFAHLRGGGWDIPYRRAYGRELIRRAGLLRDHGILPVEVMPNSPGKNSTDIALVIDAMLQLHAGSVDAMCLVSSDGDFTRLGLTIRERGVPVIVFGGPGTPTALRSSCTEFHELPGNSAPKLCNSLEHADAIRKGRADLEAVVNDLIERHGRTTVHSVATEAVRRNPGFSSRACGASSLRVLLSSYGTYELVPISKKRGGIRDYLVMARSQAGECATVPAVEPQLQ